MAAQTAEDQVAVRFWGTRGSIATPGPKTLRYGGNTACVEVRLGPHLVVLDCGTGIRELGIALGREFNGKPLTAHILLSHTHWDHIQGFPFFVPAYAPQNVLTICGMPPEGKKLEGVFRVQMAEEFFPVPLPHLRATVQFCELPGSLEIGDAHISAVPVNHPGEAIGYRLEYKGRSIVYVTDHEPYCRVDGETAENRRLERDLARFTRNADLYIREAQYTDEEYAERRGWGHSTFSDALVAARDACAQAMVIMHHDPMHDDDCLDRLLNDCRAQAETMQLRTKVDFAYEGLEYHL
ncbi:MAG: MBL fold metallo-hydrolase [Acidobacteria bacterium]|nr:MBL fold metallo-hydrolase [Acidobacteriota bacterium]